MGLENLWILIYARAPGSNPCCILREDDCLLHGWCLWYLKQNCHTQSNIGFLLCYLNRGFRVLNFTFRSVTHFVLSFLKDVSILFCM